MKFLTESSVVPASALPSKREKLPLPSVQEADEYRIYFNEHKETQPSTDEEGEETEIEVTAYDYVSALCDHEPTDEEWAECLTAEGYTSTKIEEILASE